MSKSSKKKTSSKTPKESTSTATPTPETLPTTPVDLVAAKQSLDAQVANGLPQASADAEYNKLKGIASKQGAAVSGLVGADGNAATILSNQLFPEGSLGRVSTGFDASGNRIAENQDVLNRFKGIANHYFENPLSGDEKEYTQTLKDRSNGYTTSEMTQMREQLGRENKTGLQTALAEMAKQNRGVRGPRSARLNTIISNTYGNNLLKNEQDLQVRNADEKTKRLSLYGDQVNTNSTNIYNRQSGTLANYSTALKSQQADEQDRAKFNLNQVAAEKAGQYGSYFGGLNLALGNKQAASTKDYNEQMLEIAKKGYS